MRQGARGRAESNPEWMKDAVQAQDFAAALPAWSPYSKWLKGNWKSLVGHAVVVSELLPTFRTIVVSPFSGLSSPRSWNMSVRPYVTSQALIPINL